MRGITKRFPGVLANDARRLRGRRRRGARAARRERRREEHPLEHPHRPLPAGRGRDPSCTASRRASTRRATRSTPGSGMVHQHFRLVSRRSRSPRTSSSATTATTARRSSCRPRPIEQHVAELGRRYGIAVEPHARDLAALARRAAAGRDPEGALPRGEDPDPRRADRRADAAGGGGALRHAADDGGGGPDDDLHLAQAARGEGGRRPRDRAARRAVGGDGDDRPRRRRESWPR